jgi:hypothetical protein
LLELLEDRARSTRLLGALSTLAAAPDRQGQRAKLPLTWAWGVLGHDQPLARAGATLFAEDRIWLRLQAQSERAEHWFVNLIYVDPLGRPWQLNTRQPEGLEFAKGEREELGLRRGAGQQGLRLPGTSALDRCASRRAQLIMLATPLPLELGHLVRTPDGPGVDAFAMQGLGPQGPVVRGRGAQAPELIRRWAVEIVEFDVCGGEPPASGRGSPGSSAPGTV